MSNKTEQFNKMIEASDLKKQDIYTRAGISKQNFFAIRQPENASRLTTDKILKVAKVIGVNPVKYFPELEEDVVMMVEEPMEVYQAHKTNKMVVEYFEDIILELAKSRDDYIQSLKHNISLQSQVIDLLQEKTAQQ